MAGFIAECKVSWVERELPQHHFVTGEPRREGSWILQRGNESLDLGRLWLDNHRPGCTLRIRFYWDGVSNTITSDQEIEFHEGQRCVWVGRHGPEGLERKWLPAVHVKRQQVDPLAHRVQLGENDRIFRALCFGHIPSRHVKTIVRSMEIGTSCGCGAKSRYSHR